MKQDVTNYESWEAFLDHVENDPTNPQAHDASQDKNHKPQESWDLGLGFAGSLRLAAEGYHEPLERVERLATHVESKIDLDLFQTEFEARHDVCGSEVDISRFLSGEPECMVESVPLKISKRGRAVRLLVSVTQSAGTDSEKVERRGAAIVALADLLARAQHPVEVWVQNPSVTGNQHLGTPDIVENVCIQRADEPLDVGRLLFVIAHPAAFRRLFFKSMEQCQVDRAWPSGYGYGYGRCGKIDPSTLPDQAENTFTLDTLDYNDKWDEAFCTTWITGVLDQVFG